jgi:hypothetical protein
MTTIRGPLSEVISTNIAQPSPATLFVVVDNGVEGSLTVSAAISLLGTKGDKGDPGRAGYTGSVGYTGSQGDTGYGGSRGDPGFVGSQGLTGYSGSEGDKGDKGFSGSRGNPGVGFTGSRGFPGYTGSTGTQGATGFVGSQGVSAEFINTVTNLAYGIPGSIPIQYASSLTSFIRPGNFGDLLVYGLNTASWRSTSTIMVGAATYAINSDREFIDALTRAEITPTKYLTMVSGSNDYYAQGVSSDLKYNTNEKLLTSPNITISDPTTSTNTLTGALVVTGGAGIGGNVYIGKNLTVSGTINAKQLTIEYTTITYSATVLDDIVTITNETNSTESDNGALIVKGGVGISKDLHVGGTIYGILQGSIAQASNLAGGDVGKMPFQTAPDATAFIGAGTAGQVLISNGPSAVGPVFKNTSSLLVGYAVNLFAGLQYSIPYQFNPSVTRFLAIGAIGTVLTSRGPGGLAWDSLSNISIGFATTSSNLSGGTAGQVPYQTGAGRTSFYGPGNVGDILISQGTNSPIYVGTSTVHVGRASLADNLLGGEDGFIPIQSGRNKTSFITTGSVGYVLQMQLDNTATWVSATSLAGGIATTATNLANGAAGQIPYQTNVGKTSFTTTGTLGNILISGGRNSPTWISVDDIDIGKARNLSGGNQGSIPIQVASDKTTFIPLGTEGYVLTADATTATWQNPSFLTAGNANTSTNLKGGGQGSIPIQSSSGQTTFIQLGTAGYVLTAGSTTATWQSASVLTVSTASNLAGGSAGRVVYQTDVGKTGFTNVGEVGQLLVSANTNSPSWISTSSLYVNRATLADNLVGGAAGYIPIQYGTNKTTFIPIGDADTVLKSDGSTATWSLLSGISAGSATTATHLANGSAGRVPYQTNIGRTSFTGVGSTGSVFVGAGPNSPIWLSTGSLYVGNAKDAELASKATLATNLVGGAAGSIPYQTNTGTTAFIGIGLEGAFLTVLNSTATWITPEDISIGNATTATHLAFGSAGKVPYQTGAGRTSFTNVGSTGSVFIAAGPNSPIWISTTTLYVGNSVNAETADSSTYADNLAGGSAGKMPYQSSTGTTSFTSAGTTGQLLVSGGFGSPTWDDVSNLTAGNATTATHLANGDAGKVPYQTGAGRTSFTGVGSTGSVFVGTGPNSPIWLSTGSLYVGNAVNAETAAIATSANNLKGGVAGNIPIQSGAGITTFIGTGTVGYVLQQTSLTTASWVATSALTSGVSNTATNLAGGSPGVVPYQSEVGKTLFTSVGSTGTVFVGAGPNSPIWLSTGSLYVGNAVNAIKASTSTYADNLAGGTAGRIPYQSSTSTTAFTAVGNSGQLLLSGGTGSPTWSDVSGLSTGNATTATHLANGDAGKVPYQTAAGRTSFTNVGSTGSVFVGTGPNSPIWISTTTLYVGNSVNAETVGLATLATNLKGGDKGSVPYQSSTSTTAFIDIGAVGQVLTVGASSTLLWKDVSGLSAGNATTATHLANGDAGKVPYQTAAGRTGFTSVGSTGSVFVGAGPNSPIWSDIGVLTVGTATNTTNVKGGLAGYIPIQSGPSLTSFITTGTVGYILQMTSLTTASWVSSGDIQGIISSTANNLKGGDNGKIPYQTAPDKTGFTNSGTIGQILLSGGQGSPTWSDASALTIGNATTATNVKGGIAGNIPIQSGAGITTFIGTGTVGYVLQMTSPTTASWVALGISAGGVSTTATTVVTAQQINNATYYPTFVDDNNVTANSAKGMNVYTTSSFVINPSTGFHGIGGVTSQPNTGFTSKLAVGGMIIAGAASGTTSGGVNGLLLQGNYGTLGSLVNIGSEQSSGGLALGYAAYPSTTQGAWLSSTTPAIGRAAYVLGNTGGSGQPGTHNWYIGVSQTAAVGVAVAMTNPMSLNSTGLRVDSLGVGTNTNASGVSGEIRAGNEITAYYTSDARLKENVKTIEDPITMIDQIRGVYFDWTDEHIESRGGEDGYFVRKHDIGVIAQEIEKILPEIVATRENGFKAVKYEKIVPLLIEAIKAQQKQINQLSEMVNTLANK